MVEFWARARRRLRPHPVYRAVRHLFTSGVLEQGYGKALYRATEARIRQSLVENLVLWVFEKNARARSFYEAVGYRLESGWQRQRQFAEATAMELRYQKLLAEQRT